MRRVWLAVLVAGLMVVAAWWAWPRPATVESAPPSLQVDRILGGSAEGFKRVEGPTELRFPADHGAHPSYRDEWWYVTGNLDGQDVDRHFGFELTIFRSALRPPDAPARTSAWAADDAYMAHFAVTDVAGERTRAFDRFVRGALGLAGVETSPFRAWVLDWRLDSEGDDFLPLRLSAAQEDIALDLVLTLGKEPVLHGERGFSRKGPERGQASTYYSLTRLPAEGTVRIESETYRVRGTAWLDREWSTASLPAGTVGWDWFALQFEDGRDVMLYRLRREDGTAAVESAGTLIDARGTVLLLDNSEFTAEPRAHWVSPDTGVRYPVVWSVKIPAAGLDLVIEPWIDDQELDLAVRYWEGAVKVKSSTGQMLGNGYMELTGYLR